MNKEDMVWNTTPPQEKNEIVQFVAIWVDLMGIMLGKNKPNREYRIKINEQT